MNRSQLQTSYRPRVESLEDRTCPTCVVALVGTTLTVTGDAADDAIRILYFGPGDLSVECNGTPTQVEAPVETVVVRTGAGNDSVDAELYPYAFDADFPGTWSFDLGAGDDQGAVHVLGFSGVDFPLCVKVDGGNGNDTLFTETIGFFYAPYDLTVDGGNGNDGISNYSSGGNFDVVVTRTQGGNGDDAILEDFMGWTAFGRFEGHADGGNGSDIVVARLGGSAPVHPALPPIVVGFEVVPGARADYRLSGGNGDDALTVQYFGRLDGQLNILAEGGNGADKVVATFDLSVESTGRLAGQVRGGNGDDDMEVRVRFFETELVEHPDLPGLFLQGFAGYSDDPAPLSELAVAADGGNGFDTCLHTGLVDLLHIEDDQPI